MVWPLLVHQDVIFCLKGVYGDETLYLWWLCWLCSLGIGVLTV